MKVQFFWDREGRWNEKTTCWIRVSQGWAGGQYGTMSIPRVGHEVIVSFLEGDPDRPIITGRVYHELNQPPYTLPDNKTRTVFKSYSSPSKDKGKEKGFNELRIEDKANEEELYVHAEKDVNVYVKNDWADTICANRSETTSGSHMVSTNGKTSRKLNDDRISQLEKNDHMYIKGSRLTKINGVDSIHMQALNLKADSTIVLDAGEGIMLKVGGSFITLSPADIVLVAGMIYENCGNPAPAVEAPAIPAEPENPKGVDKGSIPNGGEMAKPMTPIAGIPSNSGKGASSQDVQANQNIRSQSDAVGFGTVEAVPEKVTLEEFQILLKKQGNEVGKGLMQAQEESYLPDGRMCEQGGFLLRNPETGKLSLQQLPPGQPGNPGEYMGMKFPASPPENAIGTFHTHPFDDTPPGMFPQRPVPSIEDVNMSRRQGIPGLVYNKNGISDYGPRSHGIKRELPGRQR